MDGYASAASRTATCSSPRRASSVFAPVKWRAPDASRQAADLMRRIRWRYRNALQKAGSGAAMEHADSAGRLSLAAEFKALVAADTTTWPYT